METGCRNRLKNRIILMVLSLLLICVLVGCSQESKVITDEQRQEEGIYKIYYTNLEKTALVIHDYKTQSEVFDGRLNEVMTAFQNPDSTNVLSALPEQVKINSTATVINELDVDFNAEYLSLDSITELLLRSALVKTLTQFQGVDSVRFTVDSQSLVIADEEVGPMTSDTFIVPTKDSINSYRNQILTLYFPSEENDTLVQEKRTVYYSTNVNTERLVMEQMLEGPKKKKLLPVAVDGTLVRDISVDNNVCTIDFSEEANSAPPAEKVTDPEVVIYAFVNSIIDSCASDHITGVRFTVEGSSDVRFRNQVNLNQVFPAMQIRSAPGHLKQHRNLLRKRRRSPLRRQRRSLPRKRRRNPPRKRRRNPPRKRRRNPPRRQLRSLPRKRRRNLLRRRPDHLLIDKEKK